MKEQMEGEEERKALAVVGGRELTGGGNYRARRELRRKMRLVIAHIPLEGSERSKRWMPLLGNAYKNSLNHVERVEWDRTG